MKRMWGMAAAIVAATLVLGGCSTGKALELNNPTAGKDGFTADFFLPTVNTVDSGEITLTKGLFNGNTNNLVFTEPFSTSQLKVIDQTIFSSHQQIYDTDGDGLLDYIVLTLRALSAQAASSVQATGTGGAAVVPGTFYKIAGVTILPEDAVLSIAADVTLPVNAAGNPHAGDTYQLYRWESSYTGPYSAPANSPGVWRYVQDVTVDSTGTTVTFSTTKLGEYAVVSSTVALTVIP